jgi:glutamine synthetase
MVRIPWLDQPSAQYVASVCDLDGTPHYFDPRSALEKIVNRIKSELNMNPVGAVELEFYLMDRASALAGKPMAPKAQINEFRPQHYQAYYLQDLDDFQPFFKDLYAACEVQGLPAKTLISEYSPGQMEIVLRHRADVLKACDEGIMLKRLIKAVAEKHGLAATFMAKPYAQWTGSGMHIHVSLGDEQGHNLFAAEDPQSNQLLMHAVGGLKAADLRAQRQFLPALPAQFIRARFGQLGDQQPHGVAAHSRRCRQCLPHRASPGRRRRQSLSRDGGHPRRHALRNYREGRSGQSGDRQRL